MASRGQFRVNHELPSGYATKNFAIQHQTTSKTAQGVVPETVDLVKHFVLEQETMTHALVESLEFESPGIRLILSRYYSRVQAQVVIDRVAYPQAECVVLEILHLSRNVHGLWPTRTAEKFSHSAAVPIFT